MNARWFYLLLYSIFNSTLNPLALIPRYADIMTKFTRDVRKTICPLKLFFCHRCFVPLDKPVPNKLHKCMKKKFISGNCSLKMFWNIWPWWPWPLTPKSIGWMCGLSLRKVGEGVLELLIGKGFGTFDLSDLALQPSDPKAFSNYWSETKRLQTDRPTSAKQYDISSSKGGIGGHKSSNVLKW